MEMEGIGPERRPKRSWLEKEILEMRMATYLCNRVCRGTRGSKTAWKLEAGVLWNNPCPDLFLCKLDLIKLL